MARSILPSRARWAAQKRRLIHRASRRGVRLELARIARDPGAWDDEAALFDDPQREISVFVRDRRSADKLNHFQRWAVRVTAGLSGEDRMARMRSVLPAGLIGDHARSHLRWLHAFRTAHDAMVREAWALKSPRRPTFFDRGELAQLLRRILEAPAGHRLFNAALKHSANVLAAKTHRLPPIIRTLQGVHDVRGFLRDSSKLPLVQQFCHAFKQTGDSARAWETLFPGTPVPTRGADALPDPNPTPYGPLR